MSESKAPPPAPPPPPPLPPLLPRAPLYKQLSWSPDTLRDEAWSRRKGNHTKSHLCQSHRHRRRSRSVTDEDLDELKACFELGFGFDSPEIDPKLSDTFPALEFYHTINKQYNISLSRSSSLSSSSMASDCDSTLVGSPTTTIFSRGDDPETVKTRLRQWAQVVACSVRQSSSS